MSSRTEAEHICFQNITESIRSAIDGMYTMAQLRPDQPWTKVAAKLEEFNGLIMASVGEGHVRGIN